MYESILGRSGCYDQRVLIEHTRVNNLTGLWEKVRSKTVYSQDKLATWLEDNKYLTVTIFRLVTYLNPPMKFEEIKELDCYGNKFQTITKMTDNDYLKFRENHINESFIIN